MCFQPHRNFLTVLIFSILNDSDTFASEACSFQLVTGPSKLILPLRVVSSPLYQEWSLASDLHWQFLDMSGKSIFLRQIPLLVIMAQVSLEDSFSAAIYLYDIPYTSDWLILSGSLHVILHTQCHIDLFI
jgi:hypothetical protein